MDQALFLFAWDLWGKRKIAPSSIYVRAIYTTIWLLTPCRLSVRKITIANKARVFLDFEHPEYLVVSGTDTSNIQTNEVRFPSLSR